MEFADTNKQEIYTSLITPHHFVGIRLCDSLFYFVAHPNHCHHYFCFITYHLHCSNRLLARWSLQKDNLLAFQSGLLSHHGTSIFGHCHISRQTQHGQARRHHSCKPYQSNCKLLCGIYKVALSYLCSLPQDVSILACDNCYALVGQRQGGFLGVLQSALQRASNHIWFERFELKDRQLVTQRLKEHVSHLSNLPILIFPEGTCINNSAVMMFKKGSFEVNATVYPVAIKVFILVYFSSSSFSLTINLLIYLV